MHKQLRRLVAPTVLLAAAASAGVRAEPLIYVTPSAIGTVDSADPGNDDTPGNNGPLSYLLPNNFSAIGAAVSPDSQTLYLLGALGGTCQLFRIDLVGTDNAAGVSTAANQFPCSFAQGTGDLAFIGGSASSGTDAYVVANAAVLDQVAAGGGTPNPIALTNALGGTAELRGVAAVGSSPNEVLYGADAGTAQLVQIDTAGGTETNLAPLGLTLTGYVALDYSASSGVFYLYNNGNLYAASAPQYAFAQLGAAPAETLTMVAAANVTVRNYTSGGAFPPTLFPPLLGLLLLRRRRAQCRAQQLL